MKLAHEFIQLPLYFDVERLQQEVSALDKSLWQPHHEGFLGNYSIPLVSVGGTNNNAFKGPMATTESLQKSPYLQQVVASFGEVIGRSRLMGLEPGAEVPLHSDINYHWYKRVRIHVPITTTENVKFYCGDEVVNMQAGEAWVFDSWKYHRVVNDSDVFRVHLVVDVSGSSRFWQLVERGNVLGQPANTPQSEFTKLAFDADQTPMILTEQFNTPLVMMPGEMEGLARELFDELDGAEGNKPEDSDFFRRAVTEFCQDWRVLWGQYGFTEAGWPHYHALRDAAYQKVRHLDQTLNLANGTQAPRMFLHCMIDPALNVEVKDQWLKPSPQKVPEVNEEQTKSAKVIQAPASRNAPCPCGSGQRYKNCCGKL